MRDRSCLDKYYIEDIELDVSRIQDNHDGSELDFRLQTALIMIENGCKDFKDRLKELEKSAR